MFDFKAQNRDQIELVNNCVYWKADAIDVPDGVSSFG